MSTNFYAKKRLSQKEWEDIQRLANLNQLELLKDAVNQASKKYHIGKRSYGWAFLFQSNGDYVEVPWSNFQELKDYLNREDVTIEDEYGEEFTVEQFWEDEVGDRLYPNENNFCLYSYYEEHPNETKYGISDEYIEDGIRWSTSEFI